MPEIRKLIAGYKGKYTISESGDILNLQSGKGVKQRFNSDGYLKTVLSVNGKQKWLFVHRLVAEAFVGRARVGQEVNHKDSVRSNNHWTNLEYTTHLDNIRHAARKGRMRFAHYGERNPSAKLSLEQVREIRSSYASGKFTTKKDVATYLGLDYQQVLRVINGVCWGNVL